MNRHFNFFNPDSDYFPFRWLVVIAIAVTGLLTYADLNGWRLLQFSDQQQWSATGPGYHK